MIQLSYADSPSNNKAILKALESFGFVECAMNHTHDMISVSLFGKTITMSRLEAVLFVNDSGRIKMWGESCRH